MRLTGTYHPIPYLLERVTDYFPAIVEASGIWRDYDKSLYSSLDSSPATESVRIKIQELRSINQKVKWEKNSVLFDFHNSSRSQLSFDDENKMRVLHLFFTSPIDGKNDILILEFPENFTMNNLNIHFKGISSMEKNIIENMVLSFLSAEYNRIFKEHDFLLNVAQIQKKKTTRIEELEQQLETSTHLYSSAIRTIIYGFCENYQSELKVKITFTEAAISKLAKSNLTLETIDSVVENAIYLAYNLNFSAPELILTEDHLQLDDIKIRSSKPSSGGQMKVHDKVKIMLDNYEEAAQILTRTDLAVNGKNVASKLNPPVTPPAITDFVNKNKNTISYLLNQYPEKWSSIRRFIRPIAILDKSEGTQKMYG